LIIRPLHESSSESSSVTPWLLSSWLLPALSTSTTRPRPDEFESSSRQPVGPAMAVEPVDEMEAADPMLEELVTSRLPTVLLPLPVSVSVPDPEQDPELELELLELELLLLVLLTSMSSSTDEFEASSLRTVFRLGGPGEHGSTVSTARTGSSKVFMILS